MLSSFSTDVSVVLQWFRKSPTRLPEATYFVFQPSSPSSNLQWRMDKLGHMVDPLNVVQNGSQRLHGNVKLEKKSYNFYAPGLKGPPGASSNQIVCLSICLSVCLSVILFFCEVRWIGCLTSQLTIFQSYMWRHIDVQAEWRSSWTYGRAPNAIDIL